MWDLLVDGICRPPRDDQYCPDDLVGGSRGFYTVGGTLGARRDFILVNKLGQRLACSHYKPASTSSVADVRLPCVIYAHCNSGSRRDAEEAVLLLTPLGISVLAFDFAGSGVSDGKWVTLGAREADDLDCVIDYLKSCSNVSTIGVWGRSMGAAAALMCQRKNRCLAALVLDSPFCRLKDLVEEVAVQMKLPVPRYMLRKLTGAMRRAVSKRAGFDIDSVAPIDHAPSCYVPAIFGHGMEDSHIGTTHSQKLHSAYPGEKSILFFRGNHLTIRPPFFYRTVAAFFHHKLGAGYHLPHPLPLTHLEYVSALVSTMLEARITAEDVDAATAASLLSIPHLPSLPEDREQAPPSSPLSSLSDSLASPHSTLTTPSSTLVPPFTPTRSHASPIIPRSHFKRPP